MRAQLLPMEPCTDAFIAGCDTNDDDLISIIEWGKCMGLTEGKEYEIMGVGHFKFTVLIVSGTFIKPQITANLPPNQILNILLS